MGNGDLDQEIFARAREMERPRSSIEPRGFARAYAALLIGGVVAAVLVYVVLLAAIPTTNADKLDVAKTALLVVGGSGALAGVYIGYRKQRTDEASHLRDRDKVFTERYTQAAAQLGNDKAAVRLAGVYALARIADDSERDRDTCLQVLCAYLRMPYELKTGDPSERQVRLTAESAIVDRLRPRHQGFWSFSVVDLRGAVLIDARFDGTVIGAFQAQGATFASSHARFTDVQITGVAQFDDATFQGVADFREAFFMGYCGFNDVTFEQGGDFERASFNGPADFRRAKFKTMVTLFEDTGFAGTADFSDAEFGRDTSFKGASFDKDALFANAKFSEHVTFQDAELTGSAIFDDAVFNPDRKPDWPEGFAHPDKATWAGRTATRGQPTPKRGTS